MRNRYAYQYPNLIRALVHAGHDEKDAVSAIESIINKKEISEIKSISEAGGPKKAIKEALIYRKKLLRNAIIS